MLAAGSSGRRGEESRIDSHQVIEDRIVDVSGNGGCDSVCTDLCSLGSLLDGEKIAPFEDEGLKVAIEIVTGTIELIDPELEAPCDSEICKCASSISNPETAHARVGIGGDASFKEAGEDVDWGMRVNDDTGNATDDLPFESGAPRVDSDIQLAIVEAKGHLSILVNIGRVTRILEMDEREGWEVVDNLEAHANVCERLGDVEAMFLDVESEFPRVSATAFQDVIGIHAKVLVMIERF